MIPFSLKLRIIISRMFWTTATFLTACYFILTYFTETDWSAKLMLDENSPVAEGRVIDKWDIHNSEESDKEGKHFGYAYSFYTPDGVEYRWVSYSNKKYKPGDKINIIYNAENPKVNRASGMRNESFPPIAYLVFAAFSLLITLIFSLVSGHIKTIRVLNNGKLAIGNKFDKVATGSSVNDQMVYKVFFKFKTQEGEEISTFVRTHKTKKIEDQKNELLIYHARHPKKIVMVDMLPKAARKFLYKEYERVSGKKLRRKVI